MNSEAPITRVIYYFEGDQKAIYMSKSRDFRALSNVPWNFTSDSYASSVSLPLTLSLAGGFNTGVMHQIYF